MVDFLHGGLSRPVWDSLKIERRQLFGCDNSPSSAEEPWQGRVLQVDQEPALALELARVNRARHEATDPVVNNQRSVSLLRFAAAVGPLGQAESYRHQPGFWRPLEQVNWGLAHAAALDFVLTLGGALHCGNTGIIDRQLAGLPEVGGRLAVATGHTYGAFEVTEKMTSGPKDLRIWALAEAILSPNAQSRRSIRGGRNTLIFKTLYGIAHSQLLNWLQGGTFGQCETCRSFFPKMDKRQRFCPPAWRIHNESQCGKRARMRKQRGTSDRFVPSDDGVHSFLLRQDNEIAEDFEASSQPAVK